MQEGVINPAATAQAQMHERKPGTGAPAQQAATPPAAQNTPILGPAIEMLGGTLNFIATTGIAVIVLGYLVSSLGLSLLVVIPLLLIVGSLVRAGGNYLTHKAVGKENQFNFMNAVLGCSTAAA